ncbi:MAG: hypothetical protein JWM10_5289 [Myxococcaceae bacterium]|nr:hypothetical protein [Myxococcaceae bacterium]
MRPGHLAPFLALHLTIALGACNDAPGGPGTPLDAAGDVIVADAPKTAQDAVADASDDVVTVDAGSPDVQRVDAGVDAAPVDARIDAGVDTGPDVVPGDIGRDVPADAGVDGGRADTGPDVPVDAGPPISCTACRTTLCRDSDTACQSSVFCLERFRCLDRCTGTFPEDCRSGCTRAWPATSQSNAFMTCLRTNCPRSCPQYP